MMGCQDCPDSSVTVYLAGSVYVLYTGGPPAAIYHALNQAVAPDDPQVARCFSRPTVHPDGSIEYPPGDREPPCPVGWQRAEPWRFTSLWPSCIYRMFRCSRQDDGSLTIVTLCGTLGHKSTEALTQQSCDQCLVRESIK
jgi:hypothetical protein